MEGCAEGKEAFIHYLHVPFRKEVQVHQFGQFLFVHIFHGLGIETWA